MSEQVRTSVSPALSTALPVDVSSAPFGKPVLAQPRPMPPGFGMLVPPAPLHGQRAGVSPKHSGVPTVQPLVPSCVMLNEPAMLSPRKYWPIWKV
jgi:hypothetical protein